MAGYDDYRQRTKKKSTRPGSSPAESQYGQPGPRPGNPPANDPRQYADKYSKPAKPPPPRGAGNNRSEWAKDPSTHPALRGEGLTSKAAQAGFNPFSAGQKRYGGGRTAPNIGPTSSPEGYAERDRIVAAKRNYMTKALKKRKSGKLFSPENLRTQRSGTNKTY